MKILLLVGLFLNCWIVEERAPLVAHELKDGQVVRRAEWIVRDQKLYVKYSVGANDATLRQLLPANPVPRSSAELSAAYEKQAVDEVLKGLVLKWNGKRVEHQKASVRRTDKHHERFVVEAEYELAPLGQFEWIQIDDENFGKFGGSVRFAMRPRGDTLMINCNVSPVLARAKPVELEGLSKDKRVRACRIRAKLKIPKTKSS